MILISTNQDWREDLMTGGEVAAIVAACAFLGLVVFLILKLNPILSKLNKTVEQVNDTMQILTRDVDNLAIEVEGLLNKTNTLVDDINGKVKKTDPLFTAIGDLGTTVSDVNESTRSLATKVSNLRPGRAFGIVKLGKAFVTRNKK